MGGCVRCFKRPQDHHDNNEHSKKGLRDNADAITTSSTLKLPKVKWDERAYENCRHFPYLGVIFESGGGQLVDVHRRITLVTAKFGKQVETCVEGEGTALETAHEAILPVCVQY